MRTPPSEPVKNTSPEKQATNEGFVDGFGVGLRVGFRVGFRVGLRVGVRNTDGFRVGARDVGRRVGGRDTTRVGGRRVSWGVDVPDVAQHFWA